MEKLGIRYVSNYITDAQADTLLGQIYNSRWTALSNRRVQKYGVEHIKEQVGLFKPLPSWCKEQAKGLSDDINHLLINEYHPNQGIMSHFDGPNYFPIVWTISLGEAARLDLKSGSAHYHLILEPNSLLVLSGEAYENFMHGISESETFDTFESLNEHSFPERYTRKTTRVSLTFRTWRKVLNSPTRSPKRHRKI
jgi:alkylated DNA repair protein alkB family protein 6